VVQNRRPPKIVILIGSRMGASEVRTYAIAAAKRGPREGWSGTGVPATRPRLVRPNRQPGSNRLKPTKVFAKMLAPMPNVNHAKRFVAVDRFHFILGPAENRFPRPKLFLAILANNPV